MPCLLLIASFIAPRVVMFFIWLLTDWFGNAFETSLWPFLGFLFMPYTTLAYLAAMLNNGHNLNGWWVGLLIIGVWFDVGGQGKSASKKFRRPPRNKAGKENKAEKA